MPRILPYEQRTSAAAPLGPGPVARPFGNAVVIDALAGAAQGVADVFQADAVARENDFGTKLDQAAEQLITDEANQAQPGAAEFTASALKKFDTLASQMANESSASAWRLNRGKVRKFIEQRTLQTRARFEGKAKAFEATETKRHRTSLFEASAARVQTILEADPERWREVGAEQLAALADAPMLPAERQRLRALVHASVTEGAVRGWMKRDPRAMLAELDNPASENALVRELSPDARDRVRKATEGQIVERESSSILGAYEQVGADAGRAALADISSSDLPPLLRDEVRNKVNAGVARLRDQRRQEHAEVLVDVETTIANDSAGHVTASRVEDLFDIGALSPQQYATYMGRIEASTVARAKQDASAAEFSAALQSGLPLDPRNSEHRKALSRAFAQDTQGAGAGSPDWQAAAGAYAARTRMLPDQALAWTRQTTRSPDPRIAAAGAQFYGAVAAAAPDAVGEIDADTKAFASTVNAMIEAGTDPARAVETARANVFDLKPELIERRRTEYTQHAKQSDTVLNQLIDHEFDPGLFASPPSATAGLKADFVSQSERYYQKTGDIVLARQLAWADLKRVYGPSQVNGAGYMMAFPPERFGVPPEEIRADIGNFLKGNPQADGAGAADVFVVPDAITLRQVNDALDGRPVQPSYKLITASGDLVLDRHGVPKRYTVPSGEELAARFKAAEVKAAADAQAMVNEARQRREEERRRRNRGYSGPGIMR